LDILCQVSQSIISTSDIDIEKVRKRFGRQFQSKSLETEEKSTHSVNNGQYCMNQEITDILLRQTLRALRIFVNDEINELDFALRNLAPEFLRSDSGKLIVIVNSVSFPQYFHKSAVSCIRD
jgi:16S rRNA C1402 N4-methylase RsmH